MAATETSTEQSPSTVTLPATVLPQHWSVHDLLLHVGVSAERIRLYPPPGMATERNVLDLDAHHDLLCELIDGVLVSKVCCWYDSAVTSQVLFRLMQHCEQCKNLGIVTGPSCPIRILPGQIRMPDVSFTSWKRLGKCDLRTCEILPTAPNLAIEIVSQQNTRTEMNRKRNDYFAAGVELIWYIDSPSETAFLFQPEVEPQFIARDGRLSGGRVVPGFELSLADVFSSVRAQATP